MTQLTNKTASPSLTQARIEKLVYGGDGLARIDGQVLLAPYVLPGELVELRPQPVKNGLLRGLDVCVLQTAPERIAPGCEYFGTCGGCQYQHAQYAYQLSQKVAILRETLQRLGGVEYQLDIPVISGPEWKYRNRIQLHFANGRLGFHPAGSHSLCAIDHCPISSPKLNEVITKLVWAVGQPQWPRFLQSLEVFTNETEVQLTVADTTRPVAARFFDWCSTFIEGLATGCLHYPAAGRTFRVSRGSFFQVNRFLIDQLVDEVVSDAHGTEAIDAYAGVGLFSLPLLHRFEKIEAVERSGPAHRDLDANGAEFSGRLRTHRASAEDFLASVDSVPDLVIADPPRAGLGNTSVAELLRIRPEALKIVSCDPATLARDLKKLHAVYQITRLTLVDLFPQTYHFEVVAHLALK
jgi:23S rRNA (uracil1939-C5)-methyltransferase